MRTQGLRYELHTRIDRPIEDVFAYIADAAKATGHEPSLLAIQRTSEGPIGVGTTFRQVATDGVGGQQTYQAVPLAGRPVGLTDLGDGRWEVAFGSLILGTLNERSDRILPTKPLRWVTTND